MLVLSDKFKDFLRVDTKREFLEGTTAAGKTTVGVYKFMIKVAASDIRDHIITGLDKGTVEKNIINADNGLIELWGMLAVYHSNGKGHISLPHIEFKTKKGTKIIYVCGYGDKARWKKILGSQVGCVYIDEVNLCDMEFLREVTHRCKYMMTTSNPDSPDLPVYKEFINKSRALARYEKDYPAELLNELTEPHIKGWVHWYFTFYDNASMTEQDIQEKIDSVPVGTKMYKNKIQGLRGKATGLIFNCAPENIISRDYALFEDWKGEHPSKRRKYLYYSIGVDTSYSKKSHDKIALYAVGITKEKKCIVLMGEDYNNKDATQPFAPSDVIPLMNAFAEKVKERYGFARTIYIDNADAGTITEAEKFKRNNACIYDFAPAWKKTKIVTRIQLQQSWMKTGDFLIVGEDCPGYVSELNTYSWTEDNQPEDGHDHDINACQYAWLPFKKEIGDPAKIAQIIKDAYKD